MIEVITLISRHMESNIYLLCESGHAIIIDPADDRQIRDAVNRLGCIVDFCILTHEHCDHTCCCEMILEEYQCDVYASDSCADNLNNDKINFTKHFSALIALQNKIDRSRQEPIHPYSARATKTFNDSLHLEWQGHNLLLKETPGHSPGSICIEVDQDIMFSGDTLFADQETNCRFAGGSKKAFKESTLPWLMSQNGNLTVYPGHGRPFILREKTEKGEKQ